MPGKVKPTLSFALLGAAEDGSVRKTRGAGGLLGYLLLELLFSINEAAMSPYETRDPQEAGASFEPARLTGTRN